MDERLVNNASFSKICKMLQKKESVWNDVKPILQATILLIPSLVSKEFVTAMALREALDRGLVWLDAEDKIEGAFASIKRFVSKSEEDFVTRAENAQLANVLLVFSAFFDTVKMFLPDREGKIHLDEVQYCLTEKSLKAYQDKLQESEKKCLDADGKRIADWDLVLPNTLEGLDEYEKRLKDFYSVLCASFRVYLDGLSCTEDLQEQLRGELNRRLDLIPKAAVVCYKEQYYALAAVCPDFFVWTNQQEHQQQRELVNKGFQSISMQLENLPKRVNDYIANGRKNNINCGSSESLSEFVESLPFAVTRARGPFSQLRYDSCSADFHGRKQEETMLKGFLADEANILWWAITGSAGRGKTRLAFEFAKNVNDEKSWTARFINWPIHRSKLVGTVFSAKETDKNLLLIFDYVHAYQNEIAKWMEQLHQQYVSKTKIRILLIERGDKKKVDNSGNYIVAPWEEMFCMAPNYPTLMKNLKYHEDNINLDYCVLTKEDGANIVYSYCKNTKRHLPADRIEYIVENAFLAGQENVTPLPLLLLTEHRLSNDSLEVSMNPLLSALENIVNRELTMLYKTADINDKLQTAAFTRIILLATILGNISPQESLLDVYAFKSCGISDRNEIIKRIINSPLYVWENDEKGSLFGLQPDLVGEYFVYTRFRCMTDAQLNKLLGLIHAKYPAEVERFFIRYIEDGRRYRFDQERAVFYMQYLPENENTFFMRTDYGQLKKCETLFTFESETTGKAYIIYTDHSRDESNNTRVYASIYDPSGHSKQLLPIETAEEWDTITTILQTIQNEVRSEYDSGNAIELDALTSVIQKKLDGFDVM